MNLVVLQPEDRVIDFVSPSSSSIVHRGRQNQKIKAPCSSFNSAQFDREHTKNWPTKLQVELLTHNFNSSHNYNLYLHFDSMWTSELFSI